MDVSKLYLYIIILKDMKTSKFTRKNFRLNGNEILFTLCYESRYGVIEKECVAVFSSKQEALSKFLTVK